MSRAVLLIALSLALPGCLVTRQVFEAEVARGRALESDLEQRELRVERLEERVRDLAKSGETLELERASLTEERLALLDDLEDLRMGNQQLLGELGVEREVRESRESEIREISGTYRSLVEELESEIESGQVEILTLRGRLQVRALDQILFQSGSVEIKPAGREVLSRVAAQIGHIPGHLIRVEGHTDDVPIATARYPSNWELSVARSARVVRFLIEQGLEADRVSAAGFSSFRPLTTNDSVENRARNRRIEIVLVPEADD